MKNITFLIALLISGFFGINRAMAQTGGEPTVKSASTYNVIVEEKTYAEGLSHDGQSTSTEAIPLKLDVYAPDNSLENRPVYMFIHGGGFRGGSRKTDAIVAMGDYFASRGWVFISISYRTTKDLGTIYTGITPQGWSSNPSIYAAMYTAQRDAKAAMRWIVANADTYNINTDFITVGGGSAGAITAIALGISEPEDFRDEISTTVDPTLLTTNLDETFKIRSIVDYWGSNVALDLLESTYGHDRYDSNDPELFIAHGTKDNTVPFSNANDLMAIYNSIGVHAELVPLDEGHTAWYATVNGKSLSDLSFEFLVERQNLNVDDVPGPTTYTLTVNNGSGEDSYEENTAVSITADAPPAGQVFDTWTVNSGGATLADASAASTTLTMAASNAVVTATYETTGEGYTETQLSAHYFETGWDGWTDGGDYCKRISWNSYPPEGSVAIQISNGDGTASSMTSPTYDLSTYDYLRIDWQYYAETIEAGKNYWLKYYDGVTWQTVATLVSGADFTNNTSGSESVTISSSSYTFPTEAQFRFECNAPNSNDRMYIDAVVITGIENSGDSVEVTGVSLSSNSGTLYPTDTEQLIATFTPFNATNQSVTWSSDNSSVAIVYQGLVTAIAEGTANITVTTVDGGFTASTTITVSATGGEPTFSNEAYGSDEGITNPKKIGDNQLFDIWIPDGPGPFPIYIFSHGGGYQKGSKESLRNSGLGAAIQADGVAFANINYRLGQGGEVATNDIISALEYIKDNPKYNIDPQKVFVGGGSAGGISMNDIIYNERVAGIVGTWQVFMYQAQVVNLNQATLASIGIPVVQSHNEPYPDDSAHSAVDAFDHASDNYATGSTGMFMHETAGGKSQFGYFDNDEDVKQVWRNGTWIKDSRDGTDTGAYFPTLGEWVWITLGETLGIAKNKLHASISVFPNPAQQIVNIELENSVNEDVPIIIYDSMGKEFKQYTFQNKKKSIDVSSWPSGIYFVRILGQRSAEKIIVK